jgi:hypothetical protein
MSADNLFDEESIKKSSRQSAWITLFGALVVGGAFLFSLWELSSVTANVNSKKKELDSLTSQAVSTQKQIEVLRANMRQLKRSYARLDTVVAASKNQKLRRAYAEAVPLITVAKPRAQAISSEKGTDERPLYDFSLWLDVPEGRKHEIASVEYEFNHPTFVQKTQRSSNPSDGFRVSYLGWGCLQSVLVRIHLKDGSTTTIDFDMCEAVGF